jgi:hypothetical protein
MNPRLLWPAKPLTAVNRYAETTLSDQNSDAELTRTMSGLATDSIAVSIIYPFVLRIDGVGIRFANSQLPPYEPSMEVLFSQEAVQSLVRVDRASFRLIDIIKMPFESSYD